MWTQPIGKPVILLVELEYCIHLPWLKVTHLLGVKEVMFKHTPSSVLGMNLVFREFLVIIHSVKKSQITVVHVFKSHEEVQLFSNCTLPGITGSCDAWEFSPYNSEGTQVSRIVSQPCCKPLYYFPCQVGIGIKIQ